MVRIVKGLLVTLCLLVIGFIAISTFATGPSSSSEALQTIVSQTHQQLNQLHKLKEELEGDQPPDNSILIDLGFVDHPILYPSHQWKNITSPCIVTAVSSETVLLLPKLIRTAQNFSEISTFVVYTLYLSEEEVKQVEADCNTSCEVIQFDFEKYPPHVKELRLNAYRPIIIQEMLQRTPEVLWLSLCMKLMHGQKFNIKYIQTKALQNGGIVSWILSSSNELPTTALTHPDMFPAFRANKHDYDFQKMSDPRAFYIINKKLIHDNFMKPWVNCALTSNCLSPIGAQDTGCKFNKKPRFRYSGCHMYDTSAFNVALGLAFGVDNDTYMEDPSIFECWESADEGNGENIVSKTVSQQAQMQNRHMDRRKRSAGHYGFSFYNFFNQR